MDRLNAEIAPILRGDNYSVDLTVKDPGGVPIDIEGRTIYMTIKLSPALPDDEAALSFSEVLSGQDARDGKAYITLSPALTEKLQPLRYWYDIQLVTSPEVVVTLMRGRVSVDADVTRDRGV